MTRKTFFSFHYKPDNWRASQVRNMGIIEGNPPVSDNDWEAITRRGESTIQKWIDDQLSGKSCTIVLIGANTAGRKWINYEIMKTWNDRKGIVGVYIHNLKDKDGYQSTIGANPFSEITLGTNGPKLSIIVKAYNPPCSESNSVYNYIKQNLSDWVEEAVSIRDNH